MVAIGIGIFISGTVLGSATDNQTISDLTAIGGGLLAGLNIRDAVGYVKHLYNQNKPTDYHP